MPFHSPVIFRESNQSVPVNYERLKMAIKALGSISAPSLATKGLIRTYVLADLKIFKGYTRNSRHKITCCWASFEQINYEKLLGVFLQFQTIICEHLNNVSAISFAANSWNKLLQNTIYHRNSPQSSYWNPSPAAWLHLRPSGELFCRSRVANVWGSSQTPLADCLQILVDKINEAQCVQKTQAGVLNISLYMAHQLLAVFEPARAVTES